MANVMHIDATFRPSAVEGLVTRLREALSARRSYHTIRAELNALGDRELEDIGLARADIPEVARAAAYGA